MVGRVWANRNIFKSGRSKMNFIKKQGKSRYIRSVNSPCISKDNGHVTQSTPVNFFGVIEERKNYQLFLNILGQK
jgi:hypothetical protein